MMTRIGKLLMAVALLITLAAAVLVWAGPNRLASVSAEPLQCVPAGPILVCFDADPHGASGCEMLDAQTMLCRSQ